MQRFPKVAYLFRCDRLRNHENAKGNTVKEDAKLIKKCLEGKLRYQRALYDKYARKMYPICYRYAKNQEDAKDILQETFVLVFRKLSMFKGEGSLEGWIRKITVNCAIRHYEKSVRQLDKADIEVIPESGFQEEILSNISANEIMEIIGQLPDGYRIVFNMYAIEGYSHREIGEILEISESSSRSQLTRARNQLINLLKEAENYLTKC